MKNTICCPKCKSQKIVGDIIGQTGNFICQDCMYFGPLSSEE